MAHPRTHPARAGFATLTLPILTLLALLSGCTVFDQERDKALATASQPATLTSVSALHADLVNLPPPRGKIVAAVYGFRDQTGQYKPSPDSSFSTAVTQGAGAMLIKSMTDSKWFIPVEREGLQNILTERRIVRALDNTPNGSNLAGLLPASILLEGGIISFESNVRTGGAGARYLGLLRCSGVDGTAVLRALIIALAVARGGVVRSEKNQQQFAQRDGLGVELHAYHFGMARLARAHLLVTRLGQMAVGVATLHRPHAAHLAEHGIGTPKTSSAQNNRGGRAVIGLLVRLHQT